MDDESQRQAHDKTSVQSVSPYFLCEVSVRFALLCPALRQTRLYSVPTLARIHAISLAVSLALSSASAPVLAQSEPTSNSNANSDSPLPTETFDPSLCPAPPKSSEFRARADVSTAPVKAKADSSEIVQENVIELHDRVSIRQDTRELTADYAKINQAEDSLSASGNVMLSEPGIELKGKTLDAALSGERAKLTAAEYRLTDRGIRGSAQEFEAKDAGLITLKQATFTSCPEGDTGWQLSANEMELDQTEGWGESWDTVIRIGEVPVFYLPWMTFPIDDRRRSGVLMPNIGYDTDNGLDITIPYYFNIAPNYDDTLSPRWIEKRGLLLGNEFRYLTDSHEGSVYAETLPNDKQVTAGLEDDRWAYEVEHRSQFNRHWYGVVKAAQVSDDSYFEDLGRSIDSANQNTVTRSGMVGFRDKHWQFSVEAFEADALQTADLNQPYRKLPDMRLLGNYGKFAGPLSFSLNASAVSFDHDLKVIGDRVDIAPKFSLPLEAIWGYFTPAVKYRYTEYELTQTTASTQPEAITREMPIYSVDTGLFFERDTQLFKNDMVQTLEPRLYYLNVPFKDQDDIPLFDSTAPTASYEQLFRDNRFIGADRQGDTEQVSVGLSTRFLSADGGVEWARVSVAQAQYFSDRQVQLYPSTGVDTRTVSPYFVEASLRFTDNWKLRAMDAYDGETRETVRSSMALHYEPDERHVLNFEHRRRNELNNVAEQAAVSFAWPIAGHWNVVGRYQYDLLDNQDVETLFGVEYESCCWGIRLVTRRYLNTPLDQDGVPLPGADDYKESIYFQFVFKGLGGAGSSGLRKLLSESIDGYEDRLTPR